jgi:hypothetical protein
MKPHLLIDLPTDSPIDLPIGRRPERQADRHTPGVQA